MRSRVWLWNVGGFFFAAAVGTLLHFLYAWSGNASWTAAFSAVNESTWEHMKLLFFAVFLYTVIQLCTQGNCYSNFLAVRAVSVFAGVCLIPVLYYTYTGILGRQIPWVNITIFYVAALVLFRLDLRLLEQGRLGGRWLQVAGLLVLLGVALLFVYCTFAPPQLGLWRDPVTGGYGIV